MILVFDLGVDVTILEKKIKVIATAGDTTIGRQNIDTTLLKHCLEKFADEKRTRIT